MQPNCAKVDEIITTNTTSIYDKNKKIKETSKPTKSRRSSKEKPEATKSTTFQRQSTPKDNGRSQSKATSALSMKQITTEKPNTKPNSAERLSYYDRWVYNTPRVVLFIPNTEETLLKNESTKQTEISSAKWYVWMLWISDSSFKLIV